MQSAQPPSDEHARLSALRSYELLDTPAELEFDDFTWLASQICQTPIALISLVDAQRQWFKSKLGIDAEETPREIAFCAHAIGGDQIFEIPNALEDERFFDNPLVTGAPDIRFYAGMPLTSPEGYKLGTLCVIDRVPRHLTDLQRECLERLGRQVVAQMELRIAKQHLQQQMKLIQIAAETSRRLAAIVESTDDAIISKNLDGIIQSWNPAAEKIFGYTAQEIVGKSVTILMPADRLIEESGILSLLRCGEAVRRLQTVRLRKDGCPIDISATISPIFNDHGVVIGASEVARDITERRRGEEKIVELNRELSIKNAAVEEDLRMARELQMALLPQKFPALLRDAADAGSAVNFFSVFRPATSVSGDFFNVIRISETAVGVFICDVMGHGVRAALVTAMMRALGEQLGDSAQDPGTLLTEINRGLTAILLQSETTLFATACYLIADIAKHRISIANAGHPSPLLVRRTPGDVIPLTAPHTAGPALGIFAEARYRTFDHSIEAKDLILLFTDGLFEAENEDQETFGESRLRESIRQSADLPPAQVVQQVFAEVERFAGGQAFADDVCLVGMEIAYLEAGSASDPAEKSAARIPDSRSSSASVGSR